MSLLLTDDEFRAVEQAVAAAGSTAASTPGSRTRAFLLSLVDRAVAASGVPGIVQPDDTMEWRHIVWERFADAAFAVRCSDLAAGAGRGRADLDRLAAWLHDTVMQTTRLDRDEWIGPWFRARKDPPEGQLETAHVGMGVATALDLCPTLFTDDEHAEIRGALREKCQVLCRTWLDTRLTERTHINNWFMVLLSGYATASAILGDDPALRWAAEQARTAATVYNSDSYGESLQYWNYATLHLSHIVDLLTRCRDAGTDLRVDPSAAAAYQACLPWVESSIVTVHDVPGWGTGYAEAVNFGDSTHMMRPSGDVLRRIAASGDPAAAASAHRLFELLYADPALEPVDRQTFGFFPTFGFATVVQLAVEQTGAAGRAPARVPPADRPVAHAHRFFDNGDAHLRPDASHPDTLLAYHGAHAALHASSHRHEDLLSFQLFFRGERIFTDPGHCCYRLATQRYSKSTEAHSTLAFETASGRAIGQKTVSGNAFVSTPPIARLTRRHDLPGGIIVGCDAAASYGNPITRAERIFVFPDEHSLFIVDLIESTEPVTATARFIVNNRDNRMTYNHPAWDRTVIRRNNAAAKLFLLSAESRVGTTYRTQDSRFDLSWGYQHDVYHPQPNQHGQGREGSTVVFSYATLGAASSIRLVHGIALDAEPSIRSWHFRTREDGAFHIEPPSREGGWALKLDDLGIQVVDVAKGTVVTEAL